MSALPHEYRLSSYEVKLVFVRGKREKGSGITLYYKKNNKPRPRFAVVISSKVAKKSVTRNTMRRKTKDILFRFVSSIKKGYDIIIVFQKQFRKRQDIEDAVLYVLKKQSLLYE
ncbi:MAG: ribonuclease P protein component [Candidatus Niyogibacteria bacterium CG10_big_fil_rev_8_21_14_0_10_46_36]|uniref:Ribonuclease P protein component n=1 Tax=Candidatus Niyogibacteria bacterium CG10_big_fil_rev_8_21_14_0_10_46_36 TaxID=1974726 RepID=A0A2H0TF62_9BACT|nr:MAG: ribonuclease P protein component [Candidatus Niyogibacteria bacterium CG10_big_fil_rev_8_21_14_0_10_46_36]